MARISATGYVHGLLDNKQTFEQFAMSCARAFGATILMRDEPADVEIPEFKPSSYYADALKEAQEKLTAIKAMTPAEVKVEWNRLRTERIASLRKSILETGQEVAAIKKMQAEVEAWEPPTPDHSGIKAFMLEQLTSSLKYADSDFEQKEIARMEAVTPQQWRADEVRTLLDRLVRYAEEVKKENERTDGRNEWVSKLRQSVRPVAAGRD